jgi:catechol 2,3-dioxygenase-like lactoylglutathione lyase family enzyme
MPQPNQSPELRFIVTNTLIVRDIQRSVAFYRDVLGATVLHEGEPTFLRLGTYGSLLMAAAVRRTISLKFSHRHRAIQTFSVSF